MATPRIHIGLQTKSFQIQIDRKRKGRAEQRLTPEAQKGIRKSKFEQQHKNSFIRKIKDYYMSVA